MNIFPDAETLRQNSINDLLLFREIRRIEESVLIAKHQGNLHVSVSDSEMTLFNNSVTITQQSELYFNDWSNKTNNSRSNEMNRVILYFETLKYKITRKKNTATNKTFYWMIEW
jgi:hypothetical protein